MIVKSNSSFNNITYPVVKLNNEMYLIGLNNKFQIRQFSNEELLYEFRFYECGFSILNQSIFFYVGSSLIEYNLKTSKESLFFKSEVNNEIWFFNESFLFEVNRTAVRREFNYSFYSILEKKIKWSEKSTNRLSSLSNTYLLFTDILGTVYKRKNILDGADIWTFDLSKNRINGKVILINNVLILPTVNQDLIAIEIETGKELWRLQNCNLHHQQQPNTGYLVGLSANSFGNNFYQVIDPMSGEKLIDKKFEDFFYETNPNLACISENHYYFISNVLGDGTRTKSERVSHLGCINLNTHELEWVEKLSQNSDKEIKYQKPEYKDGKFYLLDNRNTLHIYEDESRSTVV